MHIHIVIYIYIYIYTYIHTHVSLSLSRYLSLSLYIYIERERKTRSSHRQEGQQAKPEHEVEQPVSPKNERRVRDPPKHALAKVFRLLPFRIARTKRSETIARRRDYLGTAAMRMPEDVFTTRRPRRVALLFAALEARNDVMFLWDPWLSLVWGMFLRGPHSCI